VVEHNKLDAAVRRLQQRYVRLKWRAVGLDVCLGLALAGLLATVMIPLAGWAVSLLAVYGVLLAGAVLIFAGLAWRVRVSGLTVLQCADRVLRLQERLSTAYEYLHLGPGNVFVPGLVAEAERVAPQVDPRVVFPARFPRRIWAIPVLFVAIVGLARLDIAPLQFEDLASDEVAQEVTREGQRLERWGRRLEELAKQQRLDRSLILARHMQNLGRRLQREGGEKSQVAERISTLSQYLHRMQEELRERALMSEAGAMMAHDVLVSGKSVKQELQDILQLLQRDELPREMATVAEQGVLRLSQRLGQNPAMEQLVQSLRAGNVKAARQLLQDIIQRQQVAEEMEHLERARRALEYSSREIQRGEPGEAPTTASPETGDRLTSGAPLDFDGESMGEDMPSLEDFASPGFDEGFGAARSTRQGSEKRLRESDQSPSQVQVKSGEGAMRLGYVRYLPVQNEAHEPIEQVVVKYQHAAEEVLSQEKIPRSYREQIKQYFLAIGMMPENQQ
jgi:hypothetical protein